MRILGHGIDLVSIPRVAELLEAHPARFRERCFTPAEASYCDAGGRRGPERYAARFAAKEAAVKALGTGFRGGIAWTDLEVTRDAAGRPGLRLSGAAAAVARSRGLAEWWLSLSHTDEHAMASVIAGGGGPAGSGPAAMAADTIAPEASRSVSRGREQATEPTTETLR
ncbi:holo-ACP synthase [Phycisphaera mikurensis]|uniref:Holo-[acyl-carrier-protein] synthase n=1 Tax=Phycisphaera mikurensis (strain NBRC 102666 / KCTC 22515 / FYK2301M01) TaxID=1142394 RepID=I0IEU0_PHYMF|nr:holo-ACP synthase [Phycisphaera mikurensis]MBB6441573.1 holo-[acyl-carrier protein] synthase [Phycisphaera mikurensis]BAM03778.1 holo-[acyl-carrier-protein] synthase [Phycisphaera mikurensis NBRC 102666]